MINPEYAAVAALLLRLALGVMFLAHAWMKIKVFTPAGTAQYFKSLGLPGEVAYLTIAAEVAGGILLILGIETRWVALALVPLIVGTIVLVHGAFADAAGWSDVIGRLQKRGYNVVAVENPNLSIGAIGDIQKLLFGIARKHRRP